MAVEMLRAYPPHVLTFWCPACKREHPYDLNRWEFNGDHERPTFEPSLLVHPHSGYQPRCHLFVRDGVIDYCADSDHELAGQKVPMVPWLSEDNEWGTEMSNKQAEALCDEIVDFVHKAKIAPEDTITLEEFDVALAKLLRIREYIGRQNT